MALGIKNLSAQVHRNSESDHVSSTPNIEKISSPLPPFHPVVSPEHFKLLHDVPELLQLHMVIDASVVLTDKHVGTQIIYAATIH